MALFPRDLEQWKDAGLLERWSALADVRDQVNLQLEEKRKDKTIAANLSARVVITADGETAKLLERISRFPADAVWRVGGCHSRPQDLKTLRPLAAHRSPWRGPVVRSASAAGAMWPRSAPNRIGPACVRVALKLLQNR